MPVKHWEFANNTFRVLSEPEVQARVKSAKRAPIYLNSAAAVNQAMIDSGKSSFTRAEVAGFVRQYSTGANTMKSYSLSDLWHDIKNAGSIVVSVKDYLIEDVQEALYVLNICIDDVTSCVLETVDQAVSVIGGLFAKFAVEAQDIVDFLKATFDWDDILNTQVVLKQYLSQVIPALRLEVTAIKNGAVNGLNTIQSGVDTYLDQAIASLSDDSFGDTQARVSSGNQQDIQGSYMLRATTTHITSDSCSIAVDSLSSSDQNTLTAAFNQLINDVKDDIESLKTVIGKTPAFTSLFSDPQAFFKAGAADVLMALKTLWDISMDVMRAGVIAIFDMLDTILRSLDTLMGTRIAIPFVTDLYEHVIHPGSTLTAYELMALLGAAPMTIAYKLANNNEAPIDPNDPAVRDFMALTPAQYPTYFSAAKLSMKSSLTQRSTSSKNQSSSDDQADKEALIKIVSWGLGAVSGSAILLWGSISVLGSTVAIGSSPLRILQSILVTAEFAVLASTAPIYFAVTNDDLSIFNAAIWGTFVIPLIMDAADIFTVKNNQLERDEMSLWARTINPGLNVVLGVIHGTAFISSAIWETVLLAEDEELNGTDKGLRITNAWLKGALNVISIVPELDKVLWFSGEFAELIPLIDVAAYTTWGIGTAVMTTSDLMANIETIIR